MRLFYLFLLSFCIQGLALAQGKTMTFEDAMKFKHLGHALISSNGNFVAYDVWPDRGDGEAFFMSSNGKTAWSVDRGQRPQISGDERWGAVTVKPPFLAQLNAKKGEKLHDDLALLNLKSGKEEYFEQVKTWTFSENGKWLMVHYQNADSVDKALKKSKKKYGSPLLVRDLTKGTSLEVAQVMNMTVDSLTQYLVYAKADTSGELCGLYYREFSDPETEHTIIQKANVLFDSYEWHAQSQRLAFMAAPQLGNGKTDRAHLHWWKAGKEGLNSGPTSDEIGDGLYFPLKSDLVWTYDGKRLFAGSLPDTRFRASVRQTDTTKWTDPYDEAKILSGIEGDVWHWSEPRIKPHEIVEWKRGDRDFRHGVFHMDQNKWIQLTGSAYPDLVINHGTKHTLLRTTVPYDVELSWNYYQTDLYSVNLETGERTKVAERIRDGGNISPGGRFIVYFHDKHWYLADAATAESRNLTEGVDIPFYDEDHDYPIPPDSYGIAGWMAGDAAVLIYDKYDIWKFPTDGSAPQNLTGGEGRSNEMSYRIQRTEREQLFFNNKETLLLEGYHQKLKTSAFYSLRLDRPRLKKLHGGQMRVNFLAKARDSEDLLFTEETYDVYPDLWISNLKFRRPNKLTNYQTQTEVFNWGNAELIEWTTEDGVELQGALIKPEDYEAGKQYPVMIYFYRFFSQRAHEYPAVRVNHRPILPQFVSDGYVVFLPDIKFEIGAPGPSATKCMTSGVQKLIDMGVANPEAIGIHGHSWSGYQTAYIVTQTDMFAAAVSGAPVSNMFSAYGGIRWASGLSRQFQYELSQSRIGGTPWNNFEGYKINSPLFYIDQLNTPVLIQHGDDDGAVPWYQAIELYMAMRRLGKEGVFLQYHGEPHHLQKYPNKLDYAQKMKHYFDHYLKGVPAEEWITKGVPYVGK